MSSIFAFGKRRTDMGKFRKIRFRRMLVMLMLMLLVSCVEAVEPVAITPTSNIFAKKATSCIIVKDKADTDSSNNKVSKQWDDNFISGLGHSDLGCD